jgi:2-oxoglutarate ferredoxin oxidoreductase subunit beta
MSVAPASGQPIPLTRKDFVSDQEVRWCPGCGDYSILKSVQSILPELGIPREKFVFVSGIGCSSRFPYYMNTYGFHTIHGRAPAIATGVKLANPDLEVWVATGDGDALSIGGNHLIHALRRNIDLKILMFNNRIYGLTKGQYSPTSEFGKKTKSTPFGSLDRPFNPISLAIGSEATLVARTVDVFPAHLKDTLLKMAQHKGSAFVEILQNCNVFNDGAFEDVTERGVRDDRTIDLQAGKPLIFGKERNRGVRLNGTRLEVVEFDPQRPAADLLVHDVDEPDATIAYILARMNPPDFPLPIGIFREVELPTFDRLVHDQIDAAVKRGAGDLEKLIRGPETWEIKRST